MPIKRRFELKLNTDTVLTIVGESLDLLVAEWLGKSRGDAAIVITDDGVPETARARFVAGLRAQLPTHVLSLPAGENAKTFAILGKLLEDVVGLGVTRRTHIVSFGGGMVSNVAGMVAGLVFRGLPLVHVPTTLLAQIDAALSRKQAVNGISGKNLFGLWRAPEAVFIDYAHLGSLTRRHLASGLAEAIKLSLIGDLSLFERFEALSLPEVADDPELLQLLADRALDLSCGVLSRDPWEGTSGLYLEIGHTLGHAIEILSKGRLTHGECVSIGLVLESRLSADMGLLDSQWPARIERVLARYALPTRPPGMIQPSDILRALRYDNKRTGPIPSFVPIRDVGRMTARQKHTDQVELRADAVEAAIANAAAA
jgi:3-dehydroquinate synthetase